jgi:large subunit ribosomal protein L17
MFRNMVTSLFKHERIKTTDTRAKELSRWADHIITLAKRGDLHARRQALSIVREKDVVHKLFEEAKDRFGQRNGGYTKIVKLGRRSGDAALISVIELIDSDDTPKKKKAKPAPAAKKAAPAPQQSPEETAAPADSQAEPELTEAAPAVEEDTPGAAAAEAEDESAETETVEAAAEAEPAEAQEADPQESADDAEDPEKKSE